MVITVSREIFEERGIISSKYYLKKISIERGRNVISQEMKIYFSYYVLVAYQNKHKFSKILVNW